MRAQNMGVGQKAGFLPKIDSGGRTVFRQSEFQYCESVWFPGLRRTIPVIQT